MVKNQAVAFFQAFSGRFHGIFYNEAVDRREVR